jgi:hypothetical protein
VQLFGAFSWLPGLYKVYLIVAFATYILAGILCLRMASLLRARDPRFLRFYEIVIIFNISVAVLAILLTGFSAEYVRDVLSAVIGFIIWTAYFRKSVRVRTYMGSDMYLRMSIFSKNAQAPQPAVPDDGGYAQQPGAGWAAAPPPAGVPQNVYSQNTYAAGAPVNASGRDGSGNAPPGRPSAGHDQIPPGWEVEPVCPKCGSVNPDGKFCRMCGEKLAVVRSITHASDTNT